MKNIIIFAVMLLVASLNSNVRAGEFEEVYGTPQMPLITTLVATRDIILRENITVPDTVSEKAYFSPNDLTLEDSASSLCYIEYPSEKSGRIIKRGQELTIIKRSSGIGGTGYSFQEIEDITLVCRRINTYRTMEVLRDHFNGFFQINLPKFYYGKPVREVSRRIDLCNFSGYIDDEWCRSI